MSSRNPAHACYKLCAAPQGLETVETHMSVSWAAESSSKLYEKPEQPPGSTLSLSMPSSPSWASS